MSGLVGETNTRRSDGSNSSHLVVDEVTWRAACGKTIALVREVSAAELVEAVTCRACARAAATR